MEQYCFSMSPGTGIHYILTNRHNLMHSIAYEIVHLAQKLSINMHAYEMWFASMVRCTE